MLIHQDHITSAHLCQRKDLFTPSVLARLVGTVVVAIPLLCTQGINSQRPIADLSATGGRCGGDGITATESCAAASDIAGCDAQGVVTIGRGG